MGYPNTENTWEPKANINPRLVEQFDTENGGPLAGPSPKTPKRGAAATTPTQASTPSQRGRPPRAAPKAREEVRK